MTRMLAGRAAGCGARTETARHGLRKAERAPSRAPYTSRCGRTRSRTERTTYGLLGYEVLPDGLTDVAREEIEWCWQDNIHRFGGGVRRYEKNAVSLMTGAAYLRFIHPEVTVFNRFVLSGAVLAALAWLPGSQMGDELSFLFEPLCAAAVAPADAARPIGISVPISSETLPNAPGKTLPNAPGKRV